MSRAADHHAGISFASFPSGQDRLQVRQHAVRRLVTIAGILPQQPLHHFLQGVRRFDFASAQFGDGSRHVFEEHLPDRLATERRTAGQALVQHDARGVQVGGLGHIHVHRAGLLGRRVQGGAASLSVGQPAGQHRMRQANVDQSGAKHRSADRR